VAEPRHEFLDGCTSDRRSGAASVPKVVEVNARYPGIGARLDPDLTEVLAPELAALRADEHQAAGTGFGVAVEVNSEIRHDLRRERDNPPASLRLRRIGTKPALVELCRRLDDADLTRVRVETVTAQARQLTEPKLREGGQEHQGPEPSGNFEARSKTTGSGITGRSSDSCIPALSIRHGLRPISRSSAAVARMA